MGLSRARNAVKLRQLLNSNLVQSTQHRNYGAVRSCRHQQAGCEICDALLHAEVSGGLSPGGHARLLSSGAAAGLLNAPATAVSRRPALRRLEPPDGLLLGVPDVACHAGVEIVWGSALQACSSSSSTHRGKHVEARRRWCWGGWPGDRARWPRQQGGVLHPLLQLLRCSAHSPHA